MIFATTILHTMKKGWQLSVQLLGIPNCSAVCKFDDLKFRVLRFFGPKKTNKLKPLLYEYNCVG
jgi:hypothetical protein